ncbi:SDR family oxidoreductase [Saccharopolyspora soli]|uniref:SDR family oxidoreductase n=1 Tax=Saccharopolyspora soli TaxID=2926618 RepID=UPI0035589424
MAAMLRNAPDETGERGIVINTSSIAAYDGVAGHTGYAATKAGLIGMTLPATRELLGKGVRVNTVVAGAFDTPIYDGKLTEEVERAVSAAIPNPQRLGRPAEFAALVRSPAVAAPAPPPATSAAPPSPRPAAAPRARRAPASAPAHPARPPPAARRPPVRSAAAPQPPSAIAAAPRPAARAASQAPRAGAAPPRVLAPRLA